MSRPTACYVVACPTPCDHAKDAQSWAYQLQECRAELERTKVAMERVRRNHLRRMEHDAIDLTCGSFRLTKRDHARLNRIIEGCRAAIERKADA